MGHIDGQGNLATGGAVGEAITVTETEKLVVNNFSSGFSTEVEVDSTKFVHYRAFWQVTNGACRLGLSTGMPTARLKGGAHGSSYAAKDIDINGNGYNDLLDRRDWAATLEMTLLYGGSPGYWGVLFQATDSAGTFTHLQGQIRLDDGKSFQVRTNTSDSGDGLFRAWGYSGA